MLDITVSRRTLLSGAAAFGAAGALGMPGAAFAGDRAAPAPRPQKPAAEQKTDLDYKATGSVMRSGQPAATAKTAGDAQKYGSKLGIDVSPWMMPTFN